MNKNLIFILISGSIAYFLLKNRVKKLFSNISVGNPAVKSFSLLVSNNIFPISSFQDLKDSFIDVLASLDPFSVVDGNLPPVSFLFDLNIPVENNDTITVPENSYNGVLKLGNEIVGEVSYPPTAIPPKSENGITILKSTVKTFPSSAKLIGEKLYNSPGEFLNGFDVEGTFKSGGIEKEYNFKINPFM